MGVIINELDVVVGPAGAPPTPTPAPGAEPPAAELRQGELRRIVRGLEARRERVRAD